MLAHSIDDEWESDVKKGSFSHEDEKTTINGGFR